MAVHADVPARGRLEKHPLQEVLGALLAAPRDGCLTVSRGKIRRRLYLKGGMIVYATSTNRRDRLGEVLVAQGKLTREEHREFWEKSQSEQRLLGITLVLNGRITPSDLYQGVMAQMVTILERVRKWRRGEYRFEEDCEPKPGTVLLRIPLALLVHAGRIPLGAVAGGHGHAPAGAAGAEEELIPVEPLFLAGEPPAAAPRPGGEPAAPPAAAEDARIGEVSFHLQELRRRRGQDPHTFLGVSRDAGPEAVRLAHERIAGILAPEGLPPGLAREARELLREAAAALEAALAAPEGRGDERALTAQQLPPPPGRTPRSGQPDPRVRRLALEGRQLIKEGNWWQAAQSLRQAVRLEPGEAQFRSLLGLALIQARRLSEAEEHLLEAVRLDPGNAEHFLRLGLAYKSGRLFRKAREAFERALRLDSASKRAREELRDLPEEPHGKKEGGSLLKKLFGV